MRCMWELWVTKNHLVAQCYNINRRKVLTKLEIQRQQHSGNNNEQYGWNEPTLVEERSVTGLDDTKSTELRMKVVTRLKVATQPRAQLPRSLTKCHQREC